MQVEEEKTKNKVEGKTDDTSSKISSTVKKKGISPKIVISNAPSVESLITHKGVFGSEIIQKRMR